MAIAVRKRAPAKPKADPRVFQTEHAWVRHPVLNRLVHEAHQVLAPPPRLTLSEWADNNRRLSPEASSEPGRWDTSRAEYARGIMDAISDPTVPEIVVMSSAQVGKTELLLNAIGYYIDQDPAPILLLQPTLEMGEAFSKDRLAPMVRDTPCLKGAIKDSKSRDSGNTLLHKTFPGGHVTIAGSNSPASLASRPIRVVLADEVDRYPRTAGSEGDPLSLARKRTTTFWNRKLVSVSTPTIKGFSRIEFQWNLSDQRHFHVPCPHCDHEQPLRWSSVKWESGHPEASMYHCVECGAGWTDAERWRAIRKGRWIATHPDREIAGFHLNEIYSSWVRVAEIVRNFLEAKGSPETLKTWVNTSLGETWEEDAEKVDGNSLSSRAEDWVGDEEQEDPRIPDAVMVITAGVDVQGDRLEVERVGWGMGEESWSLDHRILYGDPSGPELWRDLDRYLAEDSIRHDGTVLPVHSTCIDSGGHHTQKVYEFCASRVSRRIWAIKGHSLTGKPVWPSRASKVGRGYNLYYIGTDSAKDVIYSRLKLSKEGPGYCHFPVGRDPAYFDQMTAEGVRTKYLKGFPVREYFLPSGRRNEALDLRVYAYAAMLSLNVRWGVVAKEMEARRVRRPVRSDPAAELQELRTRETEREAPQQRPPVMPKGKAGRRIRQSSWMR